MVEIRALKQSRDLATIEEKYTGKYRGVTRLYDKGNQVTKKLKQLKADEKRYKSWEDTIERTQRLNEIEKRRNQLIAEYNKLYNELRKED